MSQPNTCMQYICKKKSDCFKKIKQKSQPIYMYMYISHKSPVALAISIVYSHLLSGKIVPRSIPPKLRHRPMLSPPRPVGTSHQWNDLRFPNINWWCVVVAVVDDVVVVAAVVVVVVDDDLVVVVVVVAAAVVVVVVVVVDVDVDVDVDVVVGKKMDRNS